MELDDPFFDGDGEFKSILRDISSAADFTRGFWGIEDEDKTLLRVFLNWGPAREEKDKYVSLKFLSPHSLIACSDSISKSFNNLKDVESVDIYHVNFLPSHPTKPLDPEISGNTMVETIYFDKEFPHADGWVSNFNQKVHNILSLRGNQFKAASGGWARQKAVAPGTMDECSVWFAIVGWPSMQAHIEWRDSPEHRENTKLLEQYKDWWKGLVRVHSSMHEIHRCISKETL
ncbi:uncharacterized protein Bfra_004798 [Botrytis fragariae]|uniref:Uncharacterized protein n=1 Tax=Botrytis fragariae TaxID=1964551 RepID=A0A8H6AWP5_9HELO|nr:uncharacterized protein Bfra_004798 [Botrytis fragariae]KAF5874780.1 hypothetical protein Bfra_004798 [Botrytis fragariae]